MTTTDDEITHEYEHKFELCDACRKIVSQSEKSQPHSKHCAQKDAVFFHLNNSSVEDRMERRGGNEAYPDVSGEDNDEKFTNIFYMFYVLFSYFF